MVLGKLIKQARKENKLTLVELGKLTNLTQGYLSNIEGGKRNPSPEILKKLSDVLNIDYVLLLIEAGYFGDEELPDNERLKRQIDSIRHTKSILTKKIISNETELEVAVKNNDKDQIAVLKEENSRLRKKYQGLNDSIDYFATILNQINNQQTVLELEVVDFTKILNSDKPVKLNGKLLTSDEKEKLLKVSTAIFSDNNE